MRVTRFTAAEPVLQAAETDEQNELGDSFWLLLQLLL